MTRTPIGDTRASGGDAELHAVKLHAVKLHAVLGCRNLVWDKRTTEQDGVQEEAYANEPNGSHCW